MTVYVFALGINTYRDPITSLKCCEHDARSVVALFKEGFGYQAEYLEERKAEDIVDRFKALGSTVQPGDTFVFYFSGHGKAHKNDQYLLLPGVDLDVLDDQSVMGIGVLSYTALKRLTSGPGWQGVHRVFILDACRSPLMADKAGDAAVCDSEFLIRNLIKARAAKLPMDQALTVINSCALGATASEILATKHGLFTSAAVL